MSDDIISLYIVIFFCDVLDHFFCLYDQFLICGCLFCASHYLLIPHFTKINCNDYVTYFFASTTIQKIAETAASIKDMQLCRITVSLFVLQ